MRNKLPKEGSMDFPSGELACVGKLSATGNGDYRRVRHTMYSQKSELGKDMIAWKEYGPEPWGTTGISYAAAILAEREDS